MASKAAENDWDAMTYTEGTAGSQITRRRFVQQPGMVGVSAVGVGSLAPSAIASNVRRQKLGHGPLRVSRANPRYLADDTGKLVYLAGAETWGNVQDGFISTAFGLGWATHSMSAPSWT